MVLHVSFVFYEHHPCQSQKVVRLFDEGNFWGLHVEIQKGIFKGGRRGNIAFVAFRARKTMIR